MKTACLLTLALSFSHTMQELLSNLTLSTRPEMVAVSFKLSNRGCSIDQSLKGGVTRAYSGIKLIFGDHTSRYVFL